MLTLYTGRGRRDCTGQRRRDFLRAGTLGLGGLTLPWLLRTQAQAAAAGEPSFVKDKAIVLLFPTGGPPQQETFNPNMDAPAPYRSITGEVQTSLPGVTIGGTFPLLSRHARNMALVRSFQLQTSGHDVGYYHMLSGGTDAEGTGKDGFSMGSMYARLRGPNHPVSGLPRYAVIPADRHPWPLFNSENSRMLNASRPGHLGPAYAPLLPTGGGTALKNLQLNVAADRLHDRRSLLQQLDTYKRRLDDGDAQSGYDQFELQAFAMLTGGAGKAFDLSGEPQRVVDRYDTSMFLTGSPGKLRPNKDPKDYYGPSSLGKQFLMARRLIEAGCSFITISTAGWDLHADTNNVNIEEGMHMLSPPVDKALSAFLDDIEERGLMDKVVVIVTGEMGRTPKVNKGGGRDHWGDLVPLAFFGGAVKTGQVIGKSARNNDVPATEPYNADNLLATVMHTMFDVGTLRLARGLPTNLVRLIEQHKPIAELF